MKHPLISQILAENTTIQRLHVGQGSPPLLTAYQRIQKLARALSRINPTSRPYSLAFTILTVGAETEVPRLRQQAVFSTGQESLGTNYILSFERLQYQINLATSMLQ